MRYLLGGVSGERIIHPSFWDKDEALFEGGSSGSFKFSKNHLKASVWILECSPIHLFVKITNE